MYNEFSSINRFFIEPQHDVEDNNNHSNIKDSLSLSHSIKKKHTFNNPYGISQDVDPTIKYDMTKKGLSQNIIDLIESSEKQ